MNFHLFKTIPYLIFAFLFIVPIGTEAHSPDQSYLYLRIYGDAIGGRIETTAKDLNKALNLNLPDKLSQEAIKPHLATIKKYLTEHSGFKSELGTYTIKFTEPEILELEEMDDFVRWHFDLEGVTEIPESLDLEYDVFFDSDPIQSGMLIVEYNWKAGIVNNQSLISHVFGQNSRTEQLSLTDAAIWKGFVALVKLGIWHIWIGIDHILFILALILPAVVRRREDPLSKNIELLNASDNYSTSWLPVAKFKPAFMYILKIITFFTIAHSITLALAALDIITLSSRFVETIIALSIALAAVHNITPIFKAKEWVIAFGFGLFHGFGFASVLGEKGLSGDYMVLSLLGFNVGVELGQVLIICMIFPVLYLIRKSIAYPKILTYGSAVLIFISLYWSIERGMEVDLPLGKYFWMVYNSILG